MRVTNVDTNEKLISVRSILGTQDLTDKKQAEKHARKKRKVKRVQNALNGAQRSYSNLQEILQLVQASAWSQSVQASRLQKTQERKPHRSSLCFFRSHFQSGRLDNFRTLLFKTSTQFSTLLQHSALTCMI